jgi:hypothetical protein
MGSLFGSYGKVDDLAKEIQEANMVYNTHMHCVVCKEAIIGASTYDPEIGYKHLDCAHPETAKQGDVSRETGALDNILIEADKLINGDRRKDYGDPGEMFQKIADIFKLLSGIDMNKREVALMMVALKLSRMSYNPTKRDSYTDLAAYTHFAHMFSEEA